MSTAPLLAVPGSLSTDRTGLKVKSIQGFRGQLISDPRVDLDGLVDRNIPSILTSDGSDMLCFTLENDYQYVQLTRVEKIDGGFNLAGIKLPGNCSPWNYARATIRFTDETSWSCLLDLYQ